ncbi:nuclear transport factor 2 family protein [Saccharothrix texasensis]|uniref:Uncharacterized protein n=1 Tax=Saccharothrix texasensis TaxID=103734 RepID=A0A3N1HHK2_9PSEU|nr:nuclear transport factor 2 family protein [Saccharothrix texasensis]ROP41911.1 hypothetical protein EDD40_7394 [Saccharothrix texasensis]
MHTTPPTTELPLSAVTSALREVRRAFADARWRVLDLAAEGDTVSLRIRFVGSGPPTAVLSRQGDHWSLEWAGSVLTLRHTRGLGYLRELLARPGVEVFALDLVTTIGATGRLEPGLTMDEPGDLGPLLDDTARNAYRRRLADLRAEETDAEDCCDPVRASRARAEIDALTRQLAQAFGLGGRARPTGSAAERARLNTTRALRSAITRITETFPDLGHHLTTTVHTGTRNTYRPGPRPALVWRLSG